MFVLISSTTITHGPETLFFGIDDADPNFPEFRAFLDFPLDGSTGDDGVPSAARIVSATLEVLIDTVSFAPIGPTLLDLVIYPVSGPREEDFDALALLSQLLDFFASEQGRFISIDVTLLMQEGNGSGSRIFRCAFSWTSPRMSGWWASKTSPPFPSPRRCSAWFTHADNP